MNPTLLRLPPRKKRQQRPAKLRNLPRRIVRRVRRSLGRTAGNAGPAFIHPPPPGLLKENPDGIRLGGHVQGIASAAPAPLRGIVVASGTVIAVAPGGAVARNAARTAAETGAGSEAGSGVVTEAGEEGVAEVAQEADRGRDPELGVVVAVTGVLRNVPSRVDNPRRRGSKGTVGEADETFGKTAGGVVDRTEGAISPVGTTTPQTTATFQRGRQAGVGRRTPTG